MPPVGSGSCPSSEWIYFGDWCYYLKPDGYVTWDGARKACEYLGGKDSTIVSIKDYTENWYLWKAMADISDFPTSINWYIGLYKAGAGKLTLEQMLRYVF